MNELMMVTGFMDWVELVVIMVGACGCAVVVSFVFDSCEFN